MSHLIAAVSTGWVRSGIGILRTSGDGCISAAASVFRAASGRPLTEAKSRMLTLGSLLDEQGRVIDQCVAVVCRAPHSYTGEDTCEFQCHGSPAVLSAGLRALFAAGFRQAGPGEFTRRAFLNGKMDLTQAEAVIDLIDAETAEAAANAAGQVGGALVKKLTPIYDGLVDICSHYHAVLDYPDEEIEPFALENFESELMDDINALAQLLSSCARGRRLKNGVRAAIVGSPNAGKSSLLNALCGYDRVIVTDVAGTTRDTVEESVTLGRHFLRLYDTAGIRETDDTIERMGVARAEQAAQAAELVLFVCDASRPLTDSDRRAMDTALCAPHAVAILNKNDLPAAVSPSDLPFDYVISVCARTGQGLDALEQALDMLYPESAVPCDGSILTNARQASALARAGKAIESALGSMRAGMTPDAVLTDVEEAMTAMGEVTGKVVREDITNRIFERFCVGK